MQKNILKEVVLDQENRKNSLHKMVKRQIMEKIQEFAEMPHVIVISGIRRCGKSTLLRQVGETLRENNYYSINFEDERLVNFNETDFNNLYEILLEVYGKRKIFVFDEIQNVPQWEVFVRRMQDSGFKFYLTGSNASLLSKETGTKLTGRNIQIELFPFSFIEFLDLKGFKPQKNFTLKTEQRAELKRLFSEYMQNGGMPEYLIYGNQEVLKHVYQDILYRDIVSRYDIKHVKVLRELALYLLSNIGTMLSYNGLSKTFGLGSMNTIKSYIDFMEDSYLFFTVNKFSYSIKQQVLSNKKIYCADNGIVNAVSFQFSKNKGKFFENAIFIQLKRKYNEIYYYKSENDMEVDFLVKKGLKEKILYQACFEFSGRETKEREVTSLEKAMQELGLRKGFIITEDYEEKIKCKNGTIYVIPAYKWFLE